MKSYYISFCIVLFISTVKSSDSELKPQASDESLLQLELAKNSLVRNKIVPFDSQVETGFVDGGLYKIINVGDDLLLNMSWGNTSVGTEVTVWPDTNTQNQLFRTLGKGNQFLIAPITQGLKLGVIDFIGGNDLAVHDAHGDTNQLFVSQEVSPGLFRIKLVNGGTILTLRSNGLGERATLTREENSDSQLWKIIPVKQF